MIIRGSNVVIMKQLIKHFSLVTQSFIIFTHDFFVCFNSGIDSFSRSRSCIFSSTFFLSCFPSFQFLGISLVDRESCFFHLLLLVDRRDGGLASEKLKQTCIDSEEGFWRYSDCVGLLLQVRVFLTISSLGH